MVDIPDLTITAPLPNYSPEIVGAPRLTLVSSESVKIEGSAANVDPDWLIMRIVDALAGVIINGTSSSLTIFDGGSSQVSDYLNAVLDGGSA